MNNWYDDLLAKEEVPESTNWYDQMLEEKPQEPSTTGWYDEISAEPKVAEKKPDLGWGGTAKEMLKPSPAAEAVAHLGWGMTTWVPSKISGLGQIGLQKITNRVLEDVIKDERISPEKRELLRQKGAYSPEKIREMAERSEALWQILPPPESKEAKYVLEKVGKGLDKILTPFRIADEYYSKKGYPNLGYAFRFAGELLFFKAAHGLGVKSTAKLKKLRKKVIEKAPAAEIKESLDTVLDEMKIEKEGITPKADTLKGVTKSQKMRAHKIAKEKGFTDVERGDLAERITGQRSMMDMNKESAREFIDALKRGREKPVEVKIEDLEKVPVTEKEIVIKPKEVKDAGRIREEAREAGEEVRIEREEKRPVRVRDIEEDRVEAREREAKEEIVEPEVKSEIEEPPLRSELYNKFLENVGRKYKAEIKGQEILDKLEEGKITPTEVSKIFWEDTFYKLPAEAQQNIKNYLRSLTGLKPGDPIATLKGKTIKAKDWHEIAKMLGEDFTKIEYLEGPERGYVSLMAYANKVIEVEKPVKVKPKELVELKPKIEEPSLRSDLSEKVRYEGIQDDIVKSPTGELTEEPAYYVYTDLKTESTFMVPLKADLNKTVAKRLVEMEKAFKKPEVEPPLELVEDAEIPPSLKSYKEGKAEKIETGSSLDFPDYHVSEKIDIIEKNKRENYEVVVLENRYGARMERRDGQEVFRINGPELPNTGVFVLENDLSKYGFEKPPIEEYKPQYRKEGELLHGVVAVMEKKIPRKGELKAIELKPKPPSEAVKTFISDDIRTAEDMGFYADIKEMIGKKRKVGEIMKELKQKAYYEEDLKDFGYTEKDIRESIRAIKAETGDEVAIKQIQSVLKVEKKKVEKITEEERIEPKKEPVPKVEEELITAPKEIDEVRLRWEQEQVPIKNEEGRILKSKVFAMKRMKELGQTGELVKNPKGEGWLLKRERPSAEERRAEKKEWEEVLREEELGEIGEEGLGERVDVEIDTIFDPLGSERGATPLFGDIVKKIKGLRLKFRGFLDKNVLERKAEQGTFNIFDKERLIKFFSREIIESGKLKDTKYSKNIKKFEDQYIVVTDNNTHILGSTNIGETLANINHIDFDILKYSFDNLLKDKNTLQSIIKKEFKEGLIDKSEYDKARTMLGLVRDSEKVLREKVDVDIDHLWGEKGAITFDFESIRKLKDLIKGGLSRDEIVAGLKSRGATDKDINKLFAAVSVRIPIGESKWLKKGQSPLEFLPARTVGKTKEGRVLKAPAVTREDAHIVATTTDLPSDVGVGLKKAPVGEKLRWAPSEGIFTQLGKPLREVFYRRMVKAHKKSSDYAKELLKDARKLNRTFSSGSREIHSERLSIYETAQQPDGVARLKLQDVTKIPKLTPKEKIVYEARQEAYKKLYVGINKARIATGKRAFPPIENYTMWAHDMAKLKDFERISAFDKMEKIQAGLDRIRDIPSQIDKLGRTVSLKGHEKLRAGPDMPGYLILDSAENYNVYAKLAADVIHESEPIAYMHELLTKKFELSKNAPNTHKFLSQWLDFQKGHEPIMFIENPKTRRLMRTASSNVAVAYLTYQLRPAIVQLASLSLSYSKLGERFTAEGAVRLLNPYELIRVAKESNIITTRTPEEILIEAQRVYPFFRGLKGKTIAKGWAKVKRIGSIGLRFTDSVVAYLTYLGAEAKGKALYKKLPKDQRQTISIKDFSRNYADDITVQCQGSAAKSARAPLQRHAEGKLITTLGTFTIANFDFITRHLMGIKNPDITKPQTVASAMRFVLASTIISSIFSEVLQLTSPIPTPVDAFRESLETDPSTRKAFQAAVTELLEFIPIYGGKYKFDSELMGPVVDQLVKLGKGDYSSLGRLGGMPGFQALWKAYRAERQGGTTIDMVMGRYLEPPKSLTAPIGGRKTDLLAPIGED